MSLQSDTENYWNKSSSNAFDFNDDNDYEQKKSGGLNPSPFLTENSSHCTKTTNVSIEVLIPENCLDLILNEQTFESEVLPKSMTTEDELKFIRRKLQNIFYVPSMKIALQQMLQGKRSQLQNFKSIYEKECLLDAVLENAGGDNIIGTVIFLTKSLNNEQLQKILLSRPKAIELFIYYLIHLERVETIEILQNLSLSYESIILELKKIQTECKSLDTQLKKIEHLLFSRSLDYKHSLPQIFYAMIEHYYKLLKALLENNYGIELNISKNNYSSIEALYVYCMSQSKLRIHELSTSVDLLRLCSNQSISSSQLHWTILNARCASNSFSGVEQLYEKPSWNLLKHKQSQITLSLENVIMLLAEWNAPITIINFFLNKLTDPIQKLKITQKLNV